MAFCFLLLFRMERSSTRHFTCFEVYPHFIKGFAYRQRQYIRDFNLIQMYT